jgi:hypothetical protein
VKDHDWLGALVVTAVPSMAQGRDVQVSLNITNPVKVKSLGDAIQFAADRRAGAKVSDIIPVKGRSDLRLRRWQRQHIVDHCARASTWVVTYDKIIYTETKTRGSPAARGMGQGPSVVIIEEPSFA